MARGGYRPGAGRPKGSGRKILPPAKLSAADVKDIVAAAGESPLAYMLRVMNNPEVDPSRRDRIAVAAAPFVHPRIEKATPSAKAEVEAKADDAMSKFAPRPAPKLVVDNAG